MYKLKEYDFPLGADSLMDDIDKSVGLGALSPPPPSKIQGLRKGLHAGSSFCEVIQRIGVK